MKAVLLSIKPEYCERIASGKKTLEIRKVKPKLQPPFKCFIYESGKASRMVIGEFICDKITSFGYSPYNHGEYCVSMGEFPNNELFEKSCLSFEDMFEYICDDVGYAWHISNLIIYDKPKDLYKFTSCHNNNDCKNCLQHRPLFHRKGRCVNFLKRPPKSWCYVEMLDND